MTLPTDSSAESLIKLAQPLLGEIILGRRDMSAATVAAAIRTKAGKNYTGVCIHLSCGIGFCAEHAAVAEMIKGRETEIDMIVAVSEAGPLSPCGRCRELLVQVNPKNLDTKVVLAGDRIVPLRDLLPEHWLS